MSAGRAERSSASPHPAPSPGCSCRGWSGELRPGEEPTRRQELGGAERVHGAGQGAGDPRDAREHAQEPHVQLNHFIYVLPYFETKPQQSAWNLVIAALQHGPVNTPGGCQDD
ncbi:unnamed protein product [Natator depressus]